MTTTKLARTTNHPDRDPSDETARTVPLGIPTPQPLAPASRRLPAVLAWLDAEEAVVVGWDGEERLVRIGSDVPSRHRSSGHIRRDHTRFGGGGPALDRVERDRDGHLKLYLDAVAAVIDEAVAANGDVEILGPGELPGALAEVVREIDDGRPARRTVGAAASPRLTERQLVARVRERVGDAAPRIRKGS